MKIKSILALLCICASTAYAQDKKPVSLDFEARGDYEYRDIDGTKIKNDCGFKGNVVNVIIKGEISPQFSFAFRNRLNGIHKDYSFFDATDWLYLTYKPTNNFSVMAGKLIVNVAGWELYPAPIDCYFLSEFCYNFPCYQWGMTGQYTTNSGNDSFSFQVCQSPQEEVRTCMPTIWNGRADTVHTNRCGRQTYWNMPRANLSTTYRSATVSMSATMCKWNSTS